MFPDEIAIVHILTFIAFACVLALFGIMCIEFYKLVTRFSRQCQCGGWLEAVKTEKNVTYWKCRKCGDACRTLQ